MIDESYFFAWTSIHNSPFRFCLLKNIHHNSMFFFDRISLIYAMYSARTHPPSFPHLSYMFSQTFTVDFLPMELETKIKTRTSRLPLSSSPTSFPKSIHLSWTDCCWMLHIHWCVPFESLMTLWWVRCSFVPSVAPLLVLITMIMIIIVRRRIVILIIVIRIVIPSTSTFSLCEASLEAEGMGARWSRLSYNTHHHH